MATSVSTMTSGACQARRSRFRRIHTIKREGHADNRVVQADFQVVAKASAAGQNRDGKDRGGRLGGGSRPEVPDEAEKQDD